jgi:hypothetical protein
MENDDSQTTTLINRSTTTTIIVDDDVPPVFPWFGKQSFLEFNKQKMIIIVF